MIKKILAIIGIISIGAWILATVLVAFFSFPAKTIVFPILLFGCILLPIMLWIILWSVSSLTGKKNIASFRTKEMDETLLQAEQIKYQESLKDKTKKEK